MKEYFTCPWCGSHYFGRDTKAGENGKVIVLDTVRCHSGNCKWHGVWPPENAELRKTKETT